MINIFRLRPLVLAAASLMVSIGTGGAQPVPTVPPIFVAFCPNAVTQNFPTAGPLQTTWWICWREVAGNNSIANPNGLVIGPVYFRKSATAPFIRVLWDMRVSDYFVPYHPGSPRYYDLSFYNFRLTDVSAADCPAAVGGAPISPHVCKEVRDRGLMWKDFGGVRRGEELVLWGAINAANYRYIQEYTFRDDGVITARMGATGQNLPGAELTPHAHNAIWRIDIDLNGVTNNAARLRHIESPFNPAGTANDTAFPITVAEGFTWSPRTHDSVEISNPAFSNEQGHLSSYQLVPLVTGGGLTRHFEAFTRKEFWVTPYNPTQFAAKNLPTYVAGQPPVMNRDIVVWYKGSLHHHPRDEDGIYGRGHRWIGTAHVMWTGFMLVPHNLFDCSPFYHKPFLPELSLERCPVPPVVDPG
jgi:primary-amine oxidase